MVLLSNRRRSNSIRTFDWTRDNSSADFQRSTRENVDWAKSPFGRMAEWPAGLRQVVLISMADSSASAVVHGTDDAAAIVYNEAFATLIGIKHPKLQGNAVRNELLDLCAEFDAVLQRQRMSGCTETVKNQRVRQDRLGFVEEKTYTWKFVPIIGDTGEVSGSLVTVDEENKSPLRRDRSKSAAREFGNAVKSAFDHTSSQTMKNIRRLDEHFSGRSCNCEKLWQVHQQLEINEQRYEKFADYAPVGIAALTPSYEVDWANKAYYDITASPAGSKDLMSLIHPDDVDMVKSHFDCGAYQETAFTFECRMKKWASRPAVSPSEVVPELSPSWVLVSAYRESDSEQHTMCWFIDITAHKMAEELLRRRMDEAMEEKQQKERFIDMISHEVRNPLSAMIHCTDDILENARRQTSESTANVLEAAENISYCTQHIRNIVGDVLTLSKLDSRLVEICPTESRPRVVVENALKVFNGELRASDIELVLEEDVSMIDLHVDWLMFDPHRMLQILFNFVTNAVKVVKDRPERKITVKLSATNKAPCEHTDLVQCVVPRQSPRAVGFPQPYAREPSLYLVTTVQDTGPGLTSEEMANLFERFAQASPKTESRYGGSGLGLFISRDLCELQGGRIGVASTPGVGSKFVFSIETRRATAPKHISGLTSIAIPARLRHSSVSIPASMQVIRRKPVARPKEQQPASRVLVVEDNTINQKVLANQLRKRGYEVSVATHGEEALETLGMNDNLSDSPIEGDLVQRAAFDVVLMDIEMPVMDGVTCVRRIRAFEKKTPGSHRLAVIAVTANARSEHGTAALEAGMDAITTKPYKIDELVAQIQKVCKPAG